jgi:hypothetical protein
MAAYAYETEAGLVTQLQGLQSGATFNSGIDSKTAQLITNFLANNGNFQPHPANTADPTDPTVLTEGPETLQGGDPTTGVDVYELTNANFNSSALVTIPSATAVVDTNAGPDTINFFGPGYSNGGSETAPAYNANILFAAGSGGNFINMNNTTASDTILAGDGNNSVIAGNGHEVIYLGSGNSTLGASQGFNTIYGYSSLPSDGGQDVYQLQGGHNTLFGGDGASTINAFAGNNVINTGNGADSINLYGSLSPGASIYSSSSDVDSINLGSGADTVNAGPGTGTINAGTGNDTIELGNGGTWTVIADTTAASSGSTDIFQIDQSPLAGGINSITGGTAKDDFNVFGGSNSITGGSNYNQFNVTTANAQTLVGGSGYNLFDIGVDGGTSTANDTIIGGSTANEINVNAVSGNISIDGGSSAINLVDFKQFSAADLTSGQPAANSTAPFTYTFGSGASQLSVTVNNPSDTIIKFGH